MTSKPLKYFCVGGPTYGLNVSADQYTDGGVRLLRTSDINAEGDLVPAESAVYLDPARVPTESILSAGDVLLSRSGTLGKAFLVSHREEPLTYAGYLVRFRPSPDTDPRYLWYCVQSQVMQDAIGADAIQSTIGNFNGEKYANVALPSWASEEQRAIADYLDRETARIDALVAAKERIATLADERFAAIASEHIFGAVQGDTVPLKRLASCLPGLAFASDGFVRAPDEAVRLLRGVNVSPQRLRWDDVVYWPRAAMRPQMSAYALAAGDLVLGMDRPWIGSGIRVAMVTAQDLPCLLVQRVARLRTFPGTVSPRFVKHALASHEFREYFAPITTGVSVPHISDEQITAFRIPATAVDHQAEIASKLDAEATQLAALKSAVAAQVNLLREHRQTLITATVTGQIDVAVPA